MVSNRYPSINPIEQSTITVIKMLLLTVQMILGSLHLYTTNNEDIIKIMPTSFIMRTLDAKDNIFTPPYLSAVFMHGLISCQGIPKKNVINLKKNKRKATQIT